MEAWSVSDAEVVGMLPELDDRSKPGIVSCRGGVASTCKRTLSSVEKSEKRDVRERGDMPEALCPAAGWIPLSSDLMGYT